MKCKAIKTVVGDTKLYNSNDEAFTKELYQSGKFVALKSLYFHLFSRQIIL